MARIQLTGADDIIMALSKLEKGSDEIIEKAIYEGAGIVADKIKDNLAKNLSDSDETTGDLIESFGITPMDEDAKGNRNVKLGFDGYDRNGVANQLKANVMESGSSKQDKKPFVCPAVNATKKQAISSMQEILQNEMKKITGGQ